MATTVEMEQPQHLRCMEIWGGNTAIDDAIAVAGMDAWVYSEPYEGLKAGGDIHYISTCGHGHIARFAVVDVSGHGAEADPLAARLRSLMRKHINKLDQSRFVRALNKAFAAMAETGRFATALLTSYYAPTGHLIVCNAGHPPAMWYRAKTRTWQPLTGDSADKVDELFNLPLGIIDPTEYEQFAVRLETDDLVVIYSDWLIEAANGDGKQLGGAGLLAMLQSIDADTPQGFSRKLRAAVQDYRGEAPADDDQTLIVLHSNGAPPPPRTIGETLRVFGKVFGLVRV